ncbi:MAG: sugar ABC transporter permease [Chloroflexi bacterium]|nr:sugar ABC transporter permease [Chloroflexota bacterium]
MAAISSSKTRPVHKASTLARIVGASSNLKTGEALWAYAFLLPWLLGLVIFAAGPIIASFYFSFTRYDVMSPPVIIGLENYQAAFFEDDLFWPSLGRTFYFSIVYIPISLTGSLILAILLNRGLPGTTAYRTLFFLPSLTPAVATALLWQWVLHPTVGPVNAALAAIGIRGPGWLTSPDSALMSLVVMALWNSIGSNRMLIFLAALQGVPEQLVEAAQIDGAGTWAKFWHITLPMISPSILFNLIMGVIGSLQIFTSAYVTTGGGPSYATWFFALHIYSQAFKYFRMGYGSALAWIFVVILLFFTWFQLRISQRWVYYATG